MERLIEKIVELQNPTVVGLDPKLEYIPQHIRDIAYEKYGKNLEGASKAILEYNKSIIDAIYDIVPAIKPQSAYYEMFGYHGVHTLYDTVQYAKSKGMYVIMDGKRNDIGSTMEAYAIAYLGEIEVEGEMFNPFGADSLTVNGYLGTDGIKPLLSICDKYKKGIFALVKTSNPSSGELQDKKIGDKTVYETMGEMCEIWGSQCSHKYGYSPVGAVVGATYPEQLAELRLKMPTTFFLVPGYGAQGGDAEGVKNAFDKNGLGAIINSSRAVLTAWQKDTETPEEFAKAARNESLRMRDDIISYIGRVKLKSNLDD